jgi:hypothetical protein
MTVNNMKCHWPSGCHKQADYIVAYNGTYTYGEDKVATSMGIIYGSCKVHIDFMRLGFLGVEYMGDSKIESDEGLEDEK